MCPTLRCRRLSLLLQTSRFIGTIVIKSNQQCHRKGQTRSIWLDAPLVASTLRLIIEVFRRGVVISTVPMLASCTGAIHFSFLDPQGSVAATQRTHFVEMVVLLAVFVALPIFILIPWLAWRYRYGATSSRYSPKWGYSNLLEIAAWSGPAVIAVFLATLVWRSTHALDPYRPIVSDKSPLRVLVIGYDWKWLLIYPDQGVASIGVLALPVGRPVAMQLTSATVMQSLLIPALGGQIYAMGGMVTQLHLQADRPGRFMGENTMYNGDGFHQQRFIAVAMASDAFNDWVTLSRTDGMPLDSNTLKTISARTTHAQLMKALGRNPGDVSVSFNHATQDIFSSVVLTTMSGSKPPAAKGMPVANTVPSMEHKP